ncbi:ATP12 family protein [Crenalkalicoccus roseus]|uniref:ATP12 family protein n=1 Tax=Crenalkalicoccus roseus TaxID=1485588 RepID=UPI00108109F7|nr:ATP12 family protein [Crenalkalicoccus roseus]
MKRFWDSAAAAPQPGGFGVLLDGRPVRLPGGAPLVVPAAALAEAIAEEWARAGGAKGGEMSFADVPLTRLAGTAQERIAPDPAPVVTALARYGETDLLCYRAEDRRLAAEQAAQWDPLLDWAALQLDAPLRVTAGLMPVPQDATALAALRRAVAALGALELSALGVLVPGLGSLVLGLAVVHGRLEAAEAHRLATLDEAFQERFWGTDAEAAARRARIGAEVALAARLVALMRG